MKEHLAPAFMEQQSDYDEFNKFKIRSKKLQSTFMNNVAGELKEHEMNLKTLSI